MVFSWTVPGHRELLEVADVFFVILAVRRHEDLGAVREVEVVVERAGARVENSHDQLLRRVSGAPVAGRDDCGVAEGHRGDDPVLVDRGDRRRIGDRGQSDGADAEGVVAGGAEHCLDLAGDLIELRLHVALGDDEDRDRDQQVPQLQPRTSGVEAIGLGLRRRHVDDDRRHVLECEGCETTRMDAAGHARYMRAKGVGKSVADLNRYVHMNLRFDPEARG